MALRGRAGGRPQSWRDQHPGSIRGRRRVGGQGHRRLDRPRGCRGRAGGSPPRASENRAAADRAGAGMTDTKISAVDEPQAAGGRRIGVYVCHCGGNISDYVDVDRVISDIQDAGDVVVSRSTMFACADASQQEIEADIKANALDGLVVASCSPKLHTYTFRGVASRAGLNPYEYTQVNIREQCSWVHTDD